MIMNTLCDTSLTNCVFLWFIFVKLKSIVSLSDFAAVVTVDILGLDATPCKYSVASLAGIS